MRLRHAFLAPGTGRIPMARAVAARVNDNQEISDMTRATSRPTPRAAWGCLWVLAAALLSPAAVAQIYRTVDEDGNVVFTDVPPRSEQGVETVELNSGNTFTPPDSNADDPARPTWTLSYEEDEIGVDDQGTAGYETISLLSPTNDETVRENAGNVTIAAQLVPDLRPGHRLQLELDGIRVQTAVTTSFQLHSLDRGTHEVRVHVVDQAGNTLMSSDPSVFHLLRYSKLTAPNRPPRPSPTGG